MKYKKFILRMVAFFILSCSQSSFTRDKQEDSRSLIALNSDQEDNKLQDQKNPDQKNNQKDQILSAQELEEINALLDILSAQADNIAFSLQQVEQILLANKVKIDESKVTKSQIRQEIKDIKELINLIYNTIKGKPSQNALLDYLRWNKGFVDFLLPCLTNDISLMNCNNFLEFISNEVENEDSAWNKNFYEILMSDPSLTKIIQHNTKIVQKLVVASENIGLTTFNKAFRYFQEKRMPLTGKPLMTTVQNIATYGTLALLAYSAILYATPKDCDITVPYAGLKFNTNKLWFKNFIGSQNDTQLAMHSGDSQTVYEALKNFGVLNHLDRSIQVYAGPLLAPMTAMIIAYGKPTYDYVTQASKIAWDKNINYLRGDVDKTSNSSFESNSKKVYFKDMIGCEHLEKIALELADYIKHPRRYENAGIIPSTGILLTGPAQTGKSFFAQALQTLMNQEAQLSDESNNKVKFMYVTHELVDRYGFNTLFAHARQNAPFILFIDEIDTFGARRDKDGKETSELLTNMSGLNSDNKVIVIAATNRPEELDFALLKDGRLGTKIRFEYPTYEQRKEQLTKAVNQRNITTLSSEDIDAIAQETEGSSYNTLDKIVKKALGVAMQKARAVTARDFEESLDFEFRFIRPNVAMSDKEKEIVAIYHAGQAVARHILSTIRKVVKITIHAIDKSVKGKEGFAFEVNAQGGIGQNADHIKNEPIRAIKLGNVFTLNKSNNHELISDEEEENELLALLAGQAALELIKGKTFSNFGKEDRALILHMLEKQISQSNPINDAIREKAIAQKDILYKKIKDILTPHIEFITSTSKILVRSNTIDKYRWANLIKTHNL